METEKLTSTRILIAAAGVLFFAVLLGTGSNTSPPVAERGMVNLKEVILPEDGVTLPVRWGDLGAKMISVGVIDREEFKQLYTSPVRNGISNGASPEGPDDEMRSLLYGTSNGNLKITPENSGMILNLLWALGLGTKNDILERREMNNPRYGGVGGLASVGGFTLAEGNALDHYSRHPFIILSEEQRAIVERVSKNIYRPCCNNPTYLPDCNHGMAMLGLLELLASQGVSEEKMYKIALQVNSYWFPDTYLTIARYFEERGADWNEVNPKEILGSAYSSASGYQKVLKEVELTRPQGGGSCSV